VVIAYHLILTAYGFWLPNDPRGSWSDFVRAWELQKFGPATKVYTRRPVAGAKHDSAFRREAKKVLARPPVRFNGKQARQIGIGFADRVRRSGYGVLACSVMPDHAHLVIERHRYDIEKVAEFLKGAATKAMTDAGMHPFQNDLYQNGKRPTPWARHCWKCFLFTDADVVRAVKYVEENPAKQGLPRQQWTFVKEKKSSLRDSR
jgi:REP element-mobilizing transposase RayT